MTEAEADARLVALLSAERPKASLLMSEEVARQFLARARYHGVLQLVFKHLAGAGLSPDVVESIHRERATQIFWEDRHQTLLTRIVAALLNRGVTPIIFKGTALAYASYEEPWLRSRGDTDILVSEEEYPTACRVLEDEGLVRAASVANEFISYQESFCGIDDAAREHCFDLHRKTNNSPLISSLLPFAELKSHATPLERLCVGALVPSPVHALQVACIHRGVHEKVPYYTGGVASYSGDRLIWLYDIHLLASSLTTGEWAELVEDARVKGICDICREGLVKSQDRFATRVPKGALDALLASGEPLSRYLKAGMVRRAWIDLWSLPEWSSRIGYCRETLFPAPSYMRGKYDGERLRWLPWLYVRRVAEGLARRLSGRS